MRGLILAFSLACAACSTPGDLAYNPSPNIAQGAPAAVASVQVTDTRDEKPNRVATIRGGYGNPLKVLDTTRPVADEVQSAFESALKARGMLSPQGSYRFAVNLKTLYGDQFMGRRAEIELTLAVLGPTNLVVYQDTVKDGSYEFTFFDNGIFAGIETLRKHTEDLLNKTIDGMLDKKRLFDILSTPPSRVLPAS